MNGQAMERNTEHDTEHGMDGHVQTERKSTVTRKIESIFVDVVLTK